VGDCSFIWPCDIDIRSFIWSICFRQCVCIHGIRQTWAITSEWILFRTTCGKESGYLF
jgi:hypothetical protein